MKNKYASFVLFLVVFLFAFIGRAEIMTKLYNYGELYKSEEMSASTTLILELSDVEGGRVDMNLDEGLFSLGLHPENNAEGLEIGESVVDSSCMLINLINKDVESNEQADDEEDISNGGDLHTLNELIDCSDLEIVNSSGSDISCKGSALLEAEGSGNGNEIYWYDSASEGIVLGVGETYQTVHLSEGASYWVSEVYLDGPGVSTGWGRHESEYFLGMSPFLQHGLIFSATKAFTLVSVEVFSRGDEGDLKIRLIDNETGDVVDETTVAIPAGTDDKPTKVVLPLNFEILNAGEYTLTGEGGDVTLGYDYNGFDPIPGYPYPLADSGEIIDSDDDDSPFGSTKAYYYYFYNWVVDEGGLECASPREKVEVTVTEAGDVDVTSLPYVTSDNTENYENHFSGSSGSGCEISQDYLSGHDVVYTYTATEKNVIYINLSDLDGYYAGVFVYSSCEDIGENCLAAAVNGASSADIGIEEFHVEAGETYYIVLSSWLYSSYGYTLTITDFDCDSLEAPEGEEEQKFSTGETIADLKAKPTMEDVSMVWFSDAAGTDELSDSTELEDGETYYVGQKYIDCVGDLLAITVHEIICDDFEIIDVSDGKVNCKGSVLLSAEGSGKGNEIYWYEEETGGNAVWVGDEFETPDLTSSKSYWASEVYIDGLKKRKGLGLTEWDWMFGSTPTYNSGLAFVATKSFTLVSVDVYSDGSGENGLEVLLVDADTGEELTRSNYMDLPDTKGGEPILVTVMLNFVIPEEGNYYLLAADGSSPMRYQLTSPEIEGYPFELGNSGEIIGSTSSGFTSTSTYNYFFNWTILEGQKMCESPRKEVLAEVTANGDVNIENLPYSTIDNTSVYSNNFSGTPGKGCSGYGDYLNGNEVIYMYKPEEDDVLDIHFTDISENGSAGLFIYDSCGDIGVSCIGGITGVDSKDFEFGIEDFEVSEEKTYFFVISTKDGEPVGYQLEINGFICDDLESPDTPDGEDTQYFLAGEDLSDLLIEGDVNNEGFTWYDDSDGQDELSESTALEDGKTYYVSQTILGCESPLLEITAIEFDCSSLEISSTTDGYICESGYTTLTADAVGEGNDIYWYDAETGGNIVDMGKTMTTPELETTTSFWAEEVFEKGTERYTGYGQPEPVVLGAQIETSGTNGLDFRAALPFKLVSVDIYSSGEDGTISISLVDADDGKILDTHIAEVPKGMAFDQTKFKVTLNFDIPKKGNYELLGKAQNGAKLGMSYDNGGFDYPYEIGDQGLYGEILGINGLDFGDPKVDFVYTLYYWYFYNWTIEVDEAQCESSDRIEAVAYVNEEKTPTPVGDAEPEFCEGATLSDIDLEAEGEVIWYNEDGETLTMDTVLEDEQTYYASQTINSCESADRLAVTPHVMLTSPLPEGDTNQSFVLGETLADLEVTGVDLVWFSDAEGTEELPESTELVDQTTYYVSQLESGKCESELLSVTVYEVLGLEGSLMRNLIVYPNPVKSTLTIENSKTISKLELYNLLGQKVLTVRPKGLEANMDLTSLQSGVYLLRVESDNTSVIYKIIKK